MPRPHRKTRSHRLPMDTFRNRQRLLTGHDWEWCDRWRSPLTDEQLRNLWFELREELLPEHIAKHPGTRPWAWWRFESTLPRLQMNDGPEPLEPPNFFGKPSAYSVMPPADMFESEADYLIRLNLLTCSELDHFFDEGESEL